MYKLVFILVAVLAIGGGLLIGTLNSEPVRLDLLWVELHWPLGLVLVLTLASGVIIGVMAEWFLQVLPARMALRRERAAAKAAAPSSLTDESDG